MLSQSRETHSGIQLEVNERILDSCNGLMLVGLQEKATIYIRNHGFFNHFFNP